MRLSLVAAWVNKAVEKWTEQIEEGVHTGVPRAELMVHADHIKESVVYLEDVASRISMAVVVACRRGLKESGGGAFGVSETNEFAFRAVPAWTEGQLRVQRRHT